VFCTEEQVQDELEACLDFAFDTYAIFGFDVRLELSTRPDERLGSDEQWDTAESHLIQVLDRKGLSYDINPGDGSFYGPKIDLHMTDSLGRSWQIGTVQLDYNMPMRFGLTYTGADNVEHQPVMIHRALMGSYERFIAILIEHYGGELPVWLTPVQAIVLPISDRHLEYARTVRDQLLAADARVELDERTESVGRKIRDAELRKIPYMLIVGDAEQEGANVDVREHRQGRLGSMPVDDFVKRLDEQVKSRSNP
jgi:threonyl-tRNA synthetase